MNRNALNTMIRVALTAACVSAGAMLIGSLGTAAAQTTPDRTQLPIKEPKRPEAKVC